jgi:guanylate kinase
MIVLIGESASGKSTIEKELVRRGYSKIVTYTTRSPRLNEIDGIDYHFITEEEFHKLESQGFFAELATYNGWNYGTAKEDCTDNKVCVLTPHGFRQINKIKGLDIHSFYISVCRRERLIRLLTRGDDIEEAYRRSLSDVGMFDGIIDEVDHIIFNDARYLGGIKTPRELTDEILDLLNEDGD